MKLCAKRHAYRATLGLGKAQALEEDRHGSQFLVPLLITKIVGKINFLSLTILVKKCGHKQCFRKIPMRIK